MEFYLFRHDEYEKRYNCSYDINSIPIEARVHPIHGLLMIGLSSFFALLYIPTLTVIMCKYLEKTAYQLMLVIGFGDVFMLAFVAIPYGLMSITGDVFCSYPTPLYTIASVSMGLWVISTESSVILAFYRCLELWRPFVANALFKGKRTLVWIGLSLFHFTAVVFFGTPIVYNPMVGTMLLNPHAGYIEDPEGQFYNYHHKFYNRGVCFVLIGLYLAFVYLMAAQRKLIANGPSRHVIAAQRKSLIQALVICSCGAVSDAYWAIIFMGPSPPQIAIFMGMSVWIFGHGIPGVIYISMNKTLRGSIAKVFKSSAKTVVSTSKCVGLSTTRIATWPEARPTETNRIYVLDNILMNIPNTQHSLNTMHM